MREWFGCARWWMYEIVSITVTAVFALNGSAPVRAQASGGSLDPAFGHGGTAVIDFGRVDSATNVLIQRDGKLIVAGGSEGGKDAQTRFALARLNADGNLDRSFATDGKVVTNPVAGHYRVVAAAIGSDGKAVLLGKIVETRPGPQQGEGLGYVLVRYMNSGAIDRAFGVRGTVVGNFEARFQDVSDVAVSSDGKIVLVGSHSDGNLRHGVTVVRLTRTGARDLSFGVAGRLDTPLLGHDYGRSVKVQRDGKLVVVAKTDNSLVPDSIALIRYDPDGKLDRTFGRGGTVISSFGNTSSVEPRDLVVQEDGRIVMLGAHIQDEPFRYDFIMLRYFADGRPDRAFGAHGMVRTSFRRFDYSSSLLQLTDGKLVAVGATETRQGIALALARYTTHGALDRGFGNGGKVTTPFRGGAFAFGAALQRDGRVVAAGFTGDGSNSADFVVARYNP